ncbi:MAG: DUF1508 domain-containing protein [Halobacteriales archaeon]
MAKRSITDDPLVDLYARYVGEPESRQGVYGYWAFIVGYLVSLAGVAIFLSGPASTTTDAFFYREIAIVLSAVGLPIALLGVVLMLPVRRRGIQVAVVGTLVGAVATIAFTTVYPDQWAIGDLASTLIIAVYTAGVASVAGMAVLVPIITGERSVLGETIEAEAVSDQPPIILGDTLHGTSFAVFHDGEQWTWRLIEEEAIAETADRYQSRIETEDRVERVKSQIELAGMLDMEGAAFRLYEMGNERWRWTLMGQDGAVIADGGDNFAERDTAEEAVSMLKEYGPTAEPLVIDGAAFDYYPDGDRWRWRLLDEGRNPIGASPKSFADRGEAQSVTDTIRETVGTAGILSIEHFGVELYGTDDDETTEWRWRLLDGSNSTIVDGAGEYESRNAVETAVYDILETVGSAPVIEASEPVYEVTPRQSGEWYWRLVDAGTNMVAESHEDVVDRDRAEQSARLLKSNAGEAEIIQIEEIDFEVFSTAAGWRWRAVDEDRNNVAEGAGTYDSREAAEEAVERTRTQAPEADLIEFEKAAFQIYEARSGDESSEWRWRLIDEDGEVLADSGDDFYSREQATESMFTLKEYAPDADLLEIEAAAFELYQGDDDAWLWRLIDADGELIARAGSSHPSRQAARHSMDRLVSDGPNADQRTMETAAFQVYADEEDDWGWRFLLSDGTIVADGTTTHATRDQTVAAIDDLRAEATRGAIKTFDELAIVLMENDGKFRWEIVDRDRSALATSSVVYSDRDRMERVIDEFRAHAAETVVFDIEDTVFRLQQQEDGWWWSLIDESQTALMQAADPYPDERSARQAIDRIRRLAPEADTVDFEEAAFELFEDEEGWRWRLIDDRETTIAEGTDPYESRDGVVATVERIRDVVGGASIIEIDTATFELHRADSGWRWRLVSEHGDTIGRSLPTYPTRKDARESMQTVKEYGPDAQTLVAEYG